MMLVKYKVRKGSDELAHMANTLGTILCDTRNTVYLSSTAKIITCLRCIAHRAVHNLVRII